MAGSVVWTARLWIPLVIATGLSAQTPARRLLTLDDLFRVRSVSDPQISPDGAWVAYAVTTPDTSADRDDSDVWMTSWSGDTTVRLTASPQSEHTPRWSPDGRFLSFLSDRQHSDETDQLWLLDRTGGDAERVTSISGGVTGYAWSPDSRRVVLAVESRDSAGADSAKLARPTPIVVDRFQFKQDEIGYLGKQRQHLHLLDLQTRQTTPLTAGDYDELFPVWSPDGLSIAFVSKRRPDFDRDANWDLYVIAAVPGAVPRQLTTFPGPDNEPDFGTPPAWSPDGQWIAYFQGGPLNLIYYAVQKLAVVPAGGGSPRILTSRLDRTVIMPQWSPDGGSLLFLLEDDRSTQLARVPIAPAPTNGRATIGSLTTGRRYVSAFSVAPGGRIAVLASMPQAPAEVFALDGDTLRPLSKQNETWLSQLRLATVTETSFRSKDGTAVHGFVVTPPDYVTGRRYPTILRIHGGPVYQFSNEFDFDWQLFAARGYVVVAANPRGSSGRGEHFSTAIYADWGNKDAQDVLAAVDDAVARGLADPNRLGVGGWSYGGILTNYVIAQDRRFKAATSGAGISNILAGYGTDQYIREYEAELGAPWRAPDTWLRLSFPFLHADRIITPTLFLCGEKDFNVPLLNSEQMYQALRSLGVATRLIIYPDEYHEIARPSFRRDVLERYLAWYDEHLRP